MYVPWYECVVHDIHMCIQSTCVSVVHIVLYVKSKNMLVDHMIPSSFGFVLFCYPVNASIEILLPSNKAPPLQRILTHSL